MEILIAVGALVAFALASARYGHDSREVRDSELLYRTT